MTHLLRHYVLDANQLCSRFVWVVDDALVQISGNMGAEVMRLNRAGLIMPMQVWSVVSRDCPRKSAHEYTWNAQKCWWMELIGSKLINASPANSEGERWYIPCFNSACMMGQGAREVHQCTSSYSYTSPKHDVEGWAHDDHSWPGMSRTIRADITSWASKTISR